MIRSIYIIFLVAIFSSCAKLPLETITLTDAIIEEGKRMHALNISLINKMFKEKREKIDEFIKNEYTPKYLEDYMNAIEEEGVDFDKEVLDLLAEKGIIRKLEVGGEQKRFDGDTSPHYHIRCVECNRVEDIFIERHPELEKSAASCCSYKILDHHVQFSGICTNCSANA